MIQQHRQEIGDYILGHTLGSGTTGKVKVAEKKDTSEKFAIKIIKKAQFDQKPDLKRKIRREIAIMRLMDHPSILKLIEVYESQKHLYIILEYAEHGELLDYLVARSRISVEQAISFFRQIIYGLDYLHIHAICHRDLKLDNILLDSLDRVKIADFGFARWMREDIAETSCGTPHYAAPEIIKGQRYDGRMADVWSCGVILYSLIVGKLPFEDTSFRQLLLKIKTAHYTMPSDLPHDIQDLISKMLVVDPKYRITINAIKEHPAFRIGLPPKYIIPTPLAIPHINAPIDKSQIDVSVVSVLKQIGYINDEDVISELTSEKHSMAKVFFHMLKREFSPINLPWPSDKADLSEASAPSFDSLSIPPDAFEFSPTQLPLGSSPSSSSANLPIISSDKNSFNTMSNNHEGSQKDSFLARRSRKRRPDISSPNPNSIVNRASWGMVVDSNNNSDENNMMDPNDCEAFTNLPPPIENLYAVIQLFLIQQGYEFFHPDELTIYSRRSDIKLYISFTARFESIDNITICLYKWNVDLEEEFTNFFTELASTLQMAVLEHSSDSDKNRDASPETNENN